MNEQLLNRFVDSIELDGSVIELSDLKLILRHGHTHKLKIMGHKNGPSLIRPTSRFGVLAGVPVLNVHNEECEVHGVELLLTTEDNGSGSGTLEISFEGIGAVVVFSVHVIANPIVATFISCDAGQRRGIHSNRGILIPTDEGVVTLRLELSRPSNSKLVPSSGSRFDPDQISGQSVNTKVTVTNPGLSFVTLYRPDGGVEDYFSLASYLPRATFSCDGINHGKFLPIMLEANKVYRISVNMIEPSGVDLVGSFYGVPEHVDVFPEQTVNNIKVAKQPVRIFDTLCYELGGEGKNERFFRLKSEAPTGAIPIFFIDPDGLIIPVPLERI